MLQEHVLKHFERMGGRAKMRTQLHHPWWPRFLPTSFTIDVLRDRRGEYFDIVLGEKAPDMEVLQVIPDDRHLLLYSRDGQRFLCGHDERHWFVAAIGDRVSTVREAKRSLVPGDLRNIVGRFSPDATNNRRNPVFKRQGEWFFVPVTAAIVAGGEIHRNEPLQRGAGSKPHCCEELCRQGGRQVYVFGSRVMEVAEFQAAKLANPKLYRGARSMTADAEVYVRGYVRHPDHATIHLDGWHRVYINGELSAGSVRFLD